MAPTWEPPSAPYMAPTWEPPLPFPGSDVGARGGVYVGTTLARTWEPGFCFLILAATSSVHSVLPCLTRYGFGSNRAPSHLRKSFVGGSNPPRVVPFSVSLQCGALPIPS